MTGSKPWLTTTSCKHSCDFQPCKQVHPKLQVNSSAAALLYKLAADLVEPAQDDVLLDLFCGCGSFSLCLAPRVKHTVGIESNAASIAAARAGAARHGLTQKCEFVEGTVERVLGPVLKRPQVVQARHVVAIVDPPRSGAALS